MASELLLEQSPSVNEILNLMEEMKQSNTQFKRLVIASVFLSYKAIEILDAAWRNQLPSELIFIGHFLNREFATNTAPEALQHNFKNVFFSLDEFTQFN